MSLKEETTTDWKGSLESKKCQPSCLVREMENNDEMGNNNNFEMV